MDSSGSIKDSDPANWQKMLNFVKDVVRRFSATGGDMRFALVDFSDSATVEFTLDRFVNDQTGLLAQIDKTKYFGGRTDIADGFQWARERVIGQAGDRGNAPNIVILITDGIANERITETQSEANLVKQTGATVVTVGITNAVDADILRALASVPSHYISTASFAELTNIVQSLVVAACQTPEPTMPVTPTPSKLLINDTNIKMLGSKMYRNFNKLNV